MKTHANGLIKGSYKNHFPCLGVDPSRLAALLLLVHRSMRRPRALPDRCLSTQTGEVISA